MKLNSFFSCKRMNTLNENGGSGGVQTPPRTVRLRHRRSHPRDGGPADSLYSYCPVLLFS